VAIYLHSVEPGEMSALKGLIHWLRDMQYEFVSPQEFASSSTEGRKAFLSFDDNFRAWLDLLPLLDHEGVPATFYVNAEPLRDRAGTAQIEAYFGRICHAGERVPLSSSELLEIVAAGHVVGSHTYSHALLTSLRHPQAIEEIRAGMHALEDILCAEVADFSYPFGMRQPGSTWVPSSSIRTNRSAAIRWTMPIRVARRRARLTQSSLPRAFLRGAAYRLLVRGSSTSLSLPDPTCPILHVGSLNDGAAAAMVRDQDCDVVCLMGTRILTARTLSDLGRPAINIHSSDPGLIRGGPPVVWEVLGGLNAATLTIHEVVPEVDAGRILIQQAHEISFSGGLGRTVARTMENGLDPVAGLFEAALRGLQAGTIVPQDFVPGPFRTIPSIREMIKADRICRRMSRSGPRGGNSGNCSERAAGS
jgi:peptidoglycan/xylan/chitin deacetylase (PgdA/CDA1 family)